MAENLANPGEPSGGAGTREASEGQPRRFRAEPLWGRGVPAPRACDRFVPSVSVGSEVWLWRSELIGQVVAGLEVLRG